MTDKINFMVVDDSEVDNRYFELLVEIEELDLEVSFFKNGITALDYLDTLKIKNFPQVILVDINMPLINGFEFVASFEERFFKKLQSTKVFMMSSSRRLSEIEQARKLESVVDFFEKPITETYLSRYILPPIDK